MRKGFELLETRLIDEKINFSEIEKKHDFLIPPLYKLFLETFKTPLMSTKKFIAYFPDEEVGFDDFIGEITKNIKVFRSEESYNKFGMLPIINSGIHSGGICVCLSGENIDKIYLNNEVFEGKYQLIANNIFELIRGLIEVEDGENPDIYKNILFINDES